MNLHNPVKQAMLLAVLKRKKTIATNAGADKSYHSFMLEVIQNGVRYFLYEHVYLNFIVRPSCILHTMVIRVVEFSSWGKELESFLPKNQL